MGEFKHDGLAVPGRVVLAHEPAFELGKAKVDPATRQIEAAGRSETLEPRVMQVLVALARADGAIVTRDELIELCWEGRIVSDDAINRILSRIRQIASGLGEGGFAVETIPRVGYRLSRQGRVRVAILPKATEAARSATRRTVLFVGAALAAAGTGLLVWRKPWKHRPPSDAEELYRRGDIAYRFGTDEQARQGVSYLERAVQIDPNFGKAWGALALAYLIELEGFGQVEIASAPPRIRSAARRALELDPDNPEARLAQILITPFFRNWLPAEARLRTLLGRHPDHWLINGGLAVLLYDVGRNSEGIAIHRRVLQEDPLIPYVYIFLVRALSSVDRVEEAEAVLKQAFDRWPTHPILWQTKFNFLVTTGRPEAAAAFVRDPGSRPPDTPPAYVDRKLRLARAIETRQPLDVEGSVEDHRQMGLKDVNDIPYAAGIVAMLGRLDLTFEMLERYYFDRGPFGSPSPIGPYTRRWTDSLFSLPMAPARADPRFAILLQRVGLEDYWRATHSIPDFRKTA